ncbi:MAG: chemotaxis response regulator protein-glutamate methylesterase [Clostridiales Family XIII bacterium]|jgi:two-component system chemotaxis response regulator CheB|nr:chemotaxis response regulator protein-glutamate methylesterase [Clostridiales Family XIII bacterium]
MEKIKVLIIDDSLLFRGTLSKGLSRYNDIELVGVASNPFEARDIILELKPDVLTLDVEMPKMDGIKFLRKLMPQFPIPTIVVSSLKESVFEAMDAGAVDFIVKPQDSTGDVSSFVSDIYSKIKIASVAKLPFRRRSLVNIELKHEGVNGHVNPRNLVAIGASTGGTEAIFSILSKFSSNMPGFVITQHMPAGFTGMYAERLNKMTNLNVKEAKTGDMVEPGTVLIAPGDYHMRVVVSPKGGYSVVCEQTNKVNGHRPSVDVLFNSVAETAGRNGMGIILTGMGNDGAKGLKKIRDFGGYTLGQDERSSIVYGMPLAAYMLGAVMLQLPLYRMSDEIIRKLSNW